jgi:hypothetical protein
MEPEDAPKGCSSIGVNKQQRAADTKAAAKKAAAERYAARRAASSLAKNAKKRAREQVDVSRARADGAASSEDDNDAAYARMHAHCEQLERERRALARDDVVSPAPMMDDFLPPRCDPDADVQRAAAAAGGAASVATPPSPPASIAHVDDADELQRYAQLAEEQNGSLLKGTVHCELLDYLLTIALQRNQGLSREDIVDLALGYLEVALPRPILAARVEDHVNAVFPLLRKYAAARASGRDVAAGEQFNPAVHKWDADATYSDWARKYEAAYTVAPLQRRRAVLQASPRLRARQQTLFNRAPPCAATGAKRKAADHRCIECGNASVDAAGANLC